MIPRGRIVTLTRMPFTIAKTDAAQQIVYGWANVSVNADGQPVTDLQGDIIDPDDLDKAVTKFMLESRQSGVMHKGESVGDVVASIVTTPEILKAMFGDSVPANAPAGWFIGVKIADPKVFKRAVDGELAMFSIQGSAERVPVGA